MDIDKNALKSALEYIDRTWDDLLRNREDDLGTLIGLPHPYIVPSLPHNSGFTFDEQYYWDTYFVCKGLVQVGRQELAFGMLENLLYMFKRFNVIPNANRYYFTARSQHPLLTSLIFDLYKFKQDTPWMEHCMSVAEREYIEVWTSTNHPHWRNVFNGLSRYYDINVINALAEAESGWDSTTRFHERCLSFVPIDLNCLLYKYETDISKYHAIKGDEVTAKLWLDRAAQRKQNINRYMWDDKRKFFFDYDFNAHKQSEVYSLAGYYAMWVNLATKEQAQALVKTIDKFLYPGGLAATDISKPYEHTVEYRHQWCHPNGWAPLNWIAIEALEKYGYHEKAAELAGTWLKTNLDYFTEFGIFREAYNVAEPMEMPEPGLYPPQIGFAWTNAIFIDLARRYLNADPKPTEKISAHAAAV